LEEKEKMGKDERGCGILPFGECKKLPENRILTISGLKSLDFGPLFSLLCSILISSDKHCEIMVEIATILF
jgi:hypothetical protein